MGLFDKKYCDICGEKIGLLGNRKLDDGNICSKCAGKLSPFFTGRKRSTLEDIKQQLAYREQNRQNLNYFNPTRVFGSKTKVYIDDAHANFVVSKKSDYRAENADIIAISQVSNARYEIEEHRSELYRKDAQGKNVSYNPPRYEVKYEIMMFIDVTSPYFSEIKFELTDTRPDSRYTEEFRRFEQEANEIVMALSGNTNMYQQNNMGYQQNNMGYAQQNMGYQQQGFVQQPYQQSPQGFVQQQYQQPQQGFVQQPYQQSQQGYAQQPYQQPQQNFAQQQYQQPQQGYVQQNAQWVCPGCGTVSTGRFCENCGMSKS